MWLLTVNAGSSSLKLALYEEGPSRKARLAVERIGSTGTRLLITGSGETTEHRVEAKDHVGAIDEAFHHLPELLASGLSAVGHRIVHGGRDHAQPEPITARLLDELRQLEHLDPAHMPQSISVIDSLLRHFPGVPQFACFDTAFHRSPDLQVRVVNVVDLMALFPSEVHPHGMSESQFLDLFTADKPVIFAFHGYQRALHAIVHGRPRADRFHVRGFNEQGTTTTPFQMVVLNEVSRYHLAMAALQRANRSDVATSVLFERCRSALDSATAYAHAHFEDPPEIRDWIWDGVKMHNS